MNSEFLPPVAEQLFRDIQKAFLETSQIPDDLLMALKFVFGPCALQALDLVDQRSVTCVSSPSGREAFQVIGGSGRCYTCFSSCHYCPCPAFAYTVLRRNEGPLVSLKLRDYLKSYILQTHPGRVPESGHGSDSAGERERPAHVDAAQRDLGPVTSPLRSVQQEDAWMSTDALKRLFRSLQREEHGNTLSYVPP
nr:zinc finger SWIM domain-containing protein 7 isoform X1 [Labrus bergylta]